MSLTHLLRVNLTTFIFYLTVLAIILGLKLLKANSPIQLISTALALVDDAPAALVEDAGSQQKQKQLVYSNYVPDDPDVKNPSAASPDVVSYNTSLDDRVTYDTLATLAARMNTADATSTTSITRASTSAEDDNENANHGSHLFMDNRDADNSTSIEQLATVISSSSSNSSTTSTRTHNYDPEILGSSTTASSVNDQQDGGIGQQKRQPPSSSDSSASRSSNFSTTTSSTSTFIFFVGPPKTATTTHQTVLARLSTTLYQDGYDYLGTYAKRVADQPPTRAMSSNQIIICLNEKFDSAYQDLDKKKDKKNEKRKKKKAQEQDEPACWNEMKLTFNRLYENGMNVILSLELIAIWFGAGSGREKLRLLCQELLPDWRVEFVVTYRRLVEHIVSIHYELNQNRKEWHQLNRWPPKDDGQKQRGRGSRGTQQSVTQPIADLIKRESSSKNPFDPSASIKSHRQRLPGSYLVMQQAQQMIQTFNISNAAVKMLSLHDEDFLEAILCSTTSSPTETTILSAPRACSEYKSTIKGYNQDQNPSLPLAYDMIAMEIWKRNWIVHEDRLPRVKARSVVMSLLMDQVNITSRTTSDMIPALINEQLPMICPEQRHLRILSNVSWKVEQEILGRKQQHQEESDASLSDHEQAFQRMISTRKFCSVDAAAVVNKHADIWKPYIQKDI